MLTLPFAWSSWGPTTMLPLNSDFTDFLEALVETECDFVIVGAYARAAHGVVRGTGDIDVLVRPSPANAARVLAAVAKFGAPLQQLAKVDSR